MSVRFGIGERGYLIRAEPAPDVMKSMVKIYFENASFCFTILSETFTGEAQLKRFIYVWREYRAFLIWALYLYMNVGVILVHFGLCKSVDLIGKVNSCC